MTTQTPSNCWGTGARHFEKSILFHLGNIMTQPLQKGQVLTCNYGDKPIKIIVINPVGLQGKLPTVGLGYNMIEKNVGISTSTLDGWQVETENLKFVQSNVGNLYSLTPVICSDKNKRNLLEISDVCRLAYDIQASPGKIRKPILSNVNNFLKWFDATRFYSSLYNQFNLLFDEQKIWNFCQVCLAKKQELNQNRKEEAITSKLARRENGRCNVPVVAGVIDVLTDTEVIEVKKAINWKHAVGQTLIYCGYFPNHKPRIHLFGKVKVSYQKMVNADCAKLGIRVTWENTGY